MNMFLFNAFISAGMLLSVFFFFVITLYRIWPWYFLRFMFMSNQFTWTIGRKPLRINPQFRGAFLNSPSFLFCCLCIMSKNMVACFLRYAGFIPLPALGRIFFFLHLCPAQFWVPGAIWGLACLRVCPHRAHTSGSPSTDPTAHTSRECWGFPTVRS